MSSRLTAHVRSNVVGYVALFIALSAGAYAAGLPRNSVKSKQIKDGQVKLTDLAADSVDGSKVVNGSLSGADFGGTLPAGATGPQGPQGAAGATGPVGPATGPAGGDLTGSYPNPSIGPDAINGPEIAPSALTAGELAFDPATQSELNDFRVTTNHNIESAATCHNGSSDVLCAEVPFTVPPGRMALVSLWSTFTAHATAQRTVQFCPSVTPAGTASGPICRSPFSISGSLTVPADQYVSGAITGETEPLEPGTYVGSTMIDSGALDDGYVITKILVRDTVTAAP